MLHFQSIQMQQTLTLTAPGSHDLEHTGYTPFADGHGVAPIGSLESRIIDLLRQLHLLVLAAITLKSPGLIIKTFRQLLNLRRATWSGRINKTYRIGRKYYSSLYTPGWPSGRYNDLLKDELLRHAGPTGAYTGRLELVFFAITRKCPLRCEHCFEWDNLNKKETFTKGELIRIVDLYQRQGAMQFHFSGGEPLTRIHDLLEVISHAKEKSDCYVATSGFNLTNINAQRLKASGCKGIVVSIDHYLPELHDQFRHRPGIFEQATNGIRAARRAGLLTTISVCVTRSFLDNGHLLLYGFCQGVGRTFCPTAGTERPGSLPGSGCAAGRKAYRGAGILLPDHQPGKEIPELSLRPLPWLSSAAGRLLCRQQKHLYR